MAEGRAKHVFLILRIAVVAAGVVWAIGWLRGDNRLHELGGIFRQMNVLVFIGTLAMFMTSQIIVGLRWWMLLRTQHIFITTWSAVKLHYLGMFYNNFLPSAVGGDLVRAWYVTMHTDRGFEAVLSVFVDRVLGFLSMVILAVGSWVIFLGRQTLEIETGQKQETQGLLVQYRWFLICVLAAGLIALVVLGLIKRTRTGLIVLFGKLKTLFIHAIGKCRKAFWMYCNNPFTVLGVLGLTMVSQSILITVFWLLGRNLGIDASVKYYFVFFPASWVLGALPVSIGGAVVVEVLLASMFVKFAGVAPEPAAAIALCQRAVWMIASLPGAAIHLFGAHLPRRFSVDETPPEN